MKCVCYDCGLMFNDSETVENSKGDACPQCGSINWDEETEE